MEYLEGKFTDAFFVVMAVRHLLFLCVYRIFGRRVRAAAGRVDVAVIGVHVLREVLVRVRRSWVARGWRHA